MKKITTIFLLLFTGAVLAIYLLSFKSDLNFNTNSNTNFNTNTDIPNVNNITTDNTTNANTVYLPLFILTLRGIYLVIFMWPMSVINN